MSVWLKVTQKAPPPRMVVTVLLKRATSTGDVMHAVRDDDGRWCTPAGSRLIMPISGWTAIVDWELARDFGRRGPTISVNGPDAFVKRVPYAWFKCLDGLAVRHHGQTLVELDRRGGLTVNELLALAAVHAAPGLSLVRQNRAWREVATRAPGEQIDAFAVLLGVLGWGEALGKLHG